MAKKIDLNTIAKEYADGKISKEDFLYLHKMLSMKAAQQPGQQPPQMPQPPVLNNPASQVRRTLNNPKRQAGNSHAQHQPPVLQPANEHALPPEFLMQQRGGIFKYIRSHHKEVVALLGTLGIFISMFYNKINTAPPDENTSRVVMVTQSDEKHSPRIRTQDIKLIAQLMMEDNSWNSELIDDFKTQWNKLTEKEKSYIKKSDWYFDFSAMLSRQIKTSRTKAKTGDVASIYDQQALLSLADTLIFGNSEKAEKMLAEATKGNKRQQITKEQSSETPAKNSNPITQKQIEKKQKPETVAVIQKKANSEKHSQPLKRHRISRGEIEDIIHRFTTAFEAGHTRALTDLFASDKYSSSFASLNGVKSEFRQLFQNTRDRQLDLNSFFWEHDFDEARGTAKYAAKVRMIDANINKSITADVDIILRRVMGKVYITHFKLNEKKVVASAPKFIKNITKEIATKDRPDYPTPSELQDLVTQYVTAYETGDVNDLMKLFATATWTSSRTGLVEMKQTYEDLFDNTDDREVFINNVEWEIKGDKAMGTGELLLTLHTDGKIETKKGKIRVVARKSKDLVRFTQMFHILN